VALVPDVPFFKSDDNGGYESGSPTRVAFLLPDLTTTKLADWEFDRPGSAPYHRDVHWPVLEVSRGNLNVARSTRAIDLSLGSRDVFLLKREFLSLGLAATGLSCDLTVPKDPVKTSANDLSSCWWVPRMKEIAPESSLLAKASMPTGTSLPPHVAGGLSLGSGHLVVTGHNRDKDGAIQAWEFGVVKRDLATGALTFPYKERWKRAIGNELIWRQFISSTEIEAKLFDYLGNQRTIVLAPSSANPEIRLRVRNVEPEMLLFGPSSPLPSPNPPDPDFLPFYDLALAQPREGKFVPIAPSGGGGPIKNPCSPLAFEGV
jgi:hypothetical protein